MPELGKRYWSHSRQQQRSKTQSVLQMDTHERCVREGKRPTSRINDLMMWRKGLFVPLSLQRTTFRLFSDPGLAPLGQRFNGAVDYGVLVFWWWSAAMTDWADAIDFTFFFFFRKMWSCTVIIIVSGFTFRKKIAAIPPPHMTKARNVTLSEAQVYCTSAWWHCSVWLEVNARANISGITHQPATNCPSYHRTKHFRHSDNSE